MRTITRSLAPLLVLGGLVAGCSAGANDDSASPAQTVVVTQTVQEALAANLQAHESETEWDTATEVMIDLADGATSTSGTGGVVDGDTVTITQPGTYRLSGTLSDGQVVVRSTVEGTVRLVLDGADITSSTTAPIAIEEATDAVVVLAENSTNSLADTAHTLPSQVIATSVTVGSRASASNGPNSIMGHHLPTPSRWRRRLHPPPCGCSCR